MSRAKRSAAPAPPSAVRIAFQGEPGAFSEEALLSHFPRSVSRLPCREFRDVVRAVERGDADGGVLPVENTLAGSVAAAYDVLADSRLAIVGEIIWPIRHCLLGTSGAPVEELRKILSHPVALAQCTRFLSRQERAEAVAVYDTAGAAKEVAARADPSLAAVAARGAAKRYGLTILVADIQDRDDNQTRFYVISRVDRPLESPEANLPNEPGPQKTVVLLEVEDRPGSLLDVLEPFARRGINMSKLESRPGRVPWRYRFLLELDAPATDREAAEALEEVERRSSTFRILGSFPAAVRQGAAADGGAPDGAT